MKKLLLVLAAFLAVTAVSAETTYTKVTSTPTDWTGTYLIVCEKQSVVFNGGADADNIDAKMGPAILQNITIADGKITGTDALDAATFTISQTGEEDWPWAIQSKSGLYIGHKDTIDNGLSAEIEVKNKCKHKLSIDADGNFVAVPKYSVSGVYNLRYNKDADQMRFRYFAEGKKQAIQIYKSDASTSIKSVSATSVATCRKQIENGKIVIRRNGLKYNTLGVQIRE